MSDRLAELAMAAVKAFDRADEEGLMGQHGHRSPGMECPGCALDKAIEELREWVEEKQQEQNRVLREALRRAWSALDDSPEDLHQGIADEIFPLVKGMTLGESGDPK